MKKTIPFKKEIIFKSNIAEIVSISLEHSLQLEKDQMVEGKFMISGDYKVTDTSTMVEPFSYDLPFSINLDERYLLDNAVVDIDDFYYEIINDNILSVNIEVLIDKLEEKIIEKPSDTKHVELEEAKKELIEEVKKDLIEAGELVLERNDSVEEKNIEQPVEKRCVEEETSIFDKFNANVETYKSYTIYIMREGDTLDMIIERYAVQKETLENYNDLSELKVGDKIIIPC